VIIGKEGRQGRGQFTSRIGFAARRQEARIVRIAHHLAARTVETIM
jgi:hypothetical protein